ncbi:MAG TPA: hypothetical protein VGQ92_18190 [Actinoplanes sp.]|jgi:hypothetical protein|nr:hypothetical protein [Actinoplanes sp.]
MAFVHGKNTFVSLNGVDLSAYANKSDLDREADEHDVTTFGKTAHVVQGGLLGGKSGLEGIYDNTAGTGPRAVIRPLLGTVVTLIRRPEGTGVGKPQDSVSVHVKKYVETNPVADMVTWAAELTLSDVVTSTTQ